MTRKPDISEELQAVAPELAAMGAGQPGSVPEGYFESLPAVILSRIHGEEGFRLPVAPALSEPPSGYFEGLAARVLAKVSPGTGNEVTEETAALAPTLAGIGNRMPQEVPQGYFEGLAETLTASRKKPAPVFSIRALRVVRYAAAAAVVGLLFTGAWFLVRNDRQDDGPSNGIAAGGSKADTVSESALASYLDQTEALDDLAPVLSENVRNEDLALLNLDDQKVGEMLSTMTDKEIAEYVSSDPDGGPNVMKN